MNRILLSLAPAAWALFSSVTVSAELYNYSSVVTLCTGTCTSFPSMAVGSTISGSFQIDTSASASFADSDVVSFSLFINNFALPQTPPVGDLTVDNPYLITTDFGNTASNGTAGTTDAANEIIGGQMKLEILTAPLNMNGAFIIFDLTTGNGQFCIFYEVAGCIPNATQFIRMDGQFTFIDSDGDLISDDVDNCIGASNVDQRDTDGDGYGNVCDADLNNDCIVNFIDLGMFKLVLATNDADADMNGDSVVDNADLDLLRPWFFFSPQTAASVGLCDGP